MSQTETGKAVAAEESTLPIRPWNTGRRANCSLRARRPKMKSQQSGGGRREQTWYLMREQGVLTQLRLNPVQLTGSASK